MKRFIVWIIILMLVVPAGMAEETGPVEERPVLYSMSSNLRGRIRPGKDHAVVVTFDMWAPLQPTGKVSEDHSWVEILTAESDRVWVNVNYLTERKYVFNVYTLWDEGIKIRSRPGNGKVTGTARKGQILEITNVVMGYGKCSKGWVDLDYFIEDCE